MFDFTDQVVIITGGAGNLGRVAARAFADSGARVVVVGRNEEKQHRVFQDWVNGDRHILVSPYDITTEQGVSDAVADAMQRVVRLDVLINALGDSEAVT